MSEPALSRSVPPNSAPDASSEDALAAFGLAMADAFARIDDAAHAITGLQGAFHILNRDADATRTETVAILEATGSTESSARTAAAALSKADAALDKRRTRHHHPRRYSQAYAKPGGHAVGGAGSGLGHAQHH